MKVTVLGLGIMGGGMAGRLVACGLDVTVWNRNPAKAAALAEAGATVAASPAEAVRDAEVVVAMLASDDASRGVWLDQGALAAMRPGAIAIESGTLTIGWVRDLAARAAAHGIDFIDAPVTGSKDQAAGGQLRFLVGGDAGVVARTQPVFDAMGSEVFHLGPTGSGATLKLVNNFLCGVQVAALAEAIAMVEASGLDPEIAVSVIAGGAPGSPIVKAVSRRMLDRDYAPNFYVPLMAKDLAYAEAAFAQAGIDLATARAARTRFETASAAGHAEQDVAAIVEPLRDKNA